MIGAERLERALAGRREDIGEERLLVGVVAEVGLEVQACDLPNCPCALHLDTELGGADATTVGRHHVPRAHGVGVAAVAVSRGDCDAVVVGREVDDLLARPNPTWAARVGVLPEQRVEPYLRQVGERAGAREGVALAVGAAAPRRQLADLGATADALPAERGVPGDAVPALLGRGTAVDVLGDADVVKDFHRANVQQVCAREVGGEVPALEQEEVDPRLLEQERGRQTRRSAADDENGGPLLDIALRLV